MKKRILPFGIFSLLVFGLVAVYFLNIDPDKSKDIQVRQGGQNIKGAKEYLAAIRNNQHTGVLNPGDVIRARQQIEELATYKSGSNVSELEWFELGPDNIGGRTRAIIFDNRDETAKTLYAGSVTGGIFKSSNLGASWEKVNLGSGTANLNVSCMVQDDDEAGTIYVGTGEGLNTENYTAQGEFGFEGGFVGRGLYKSSDSINDNFYLIPGTEPVITEELADWAYVNQLAIDKNENRLYAATNNGLQYASLPGLSDWQSDCNYIVDSATISRSISRDSIIICDSFEIVDGELVIFGQSSVDLVLTGDDTTNIQTHSISSVAFEEYGNCYDVKVSDNGWIIATFNGYIYVSPNGDPSKFVRKSIYPDNPDNVRKDNISITTNVIVKDNSNNILYEETTTSSDFEDWHTDYVYIEELESKWAGFPSSDNEGRLSYAIAPSDQNVVYAMSAFSGPGTKHRLHKIYLSKDGGNNWMTIANGEPSGTNNYLNILGSHWTSASGSITYYYQGDYNNTLTVFPTDPYKVLAGGVNLWEGIKVSETGFYQWEEKSIGDPTLLFTGNLDPLYCHVDHHTYVFRPGTTNELFAGTDGGVYYAFYNGIAYNFQARNKNYNATQFYSIDVSTRQNEFLGGTQDNGTIYVSGEGNTPKKGVDMWRPANLDPKYPEGTDGGFVGVSNLRMVKPFIEEIDPPSVYSRSDLPDLEEDVKLRLRRSETLGFDYSANFFPSHDELDDFNYDGFLMPMVLWENYNNEISLDSVTFYADMDYLDTTMITVRSNNFNHPFMHKLTDTLENGDSIRIQDIISSKLFVAIENQVWMTCEVIRFNVTARWNLISADTKNGFTGIPSCIAVSADGNDIWVGNMDGKLYRISNLNYVYDSITGDVNSSSCVVATTEMDVYEENSQVITSIAVKPDTLGNKVLVTLGNYGNEEYLFYTENARSDQPIFISVQGNLPQMPVYSSILEMDIETDIAIIGTEEGLWMSDDVTTGEWYDVSGSIGKIPVMALKQQYLYKPRFTITYYDPGNPTQALYEIYEATDNCGLIYAATHGRGVFMDTTYYEVGVDEFPHEEKAVANLDIQIYPNPASNNITVSFNQSSKSEAIVNVYDLTGKLVRSESVSYISVGKNDIQMNISSLSKGTYIMNIVSGEKTGTVKLVIIK